MMVVTVLVVQMVVRLVELLVVALKLVMTVNLILLHMDLSVVIQHGMNLVLTVLR